MKVLVGNYVFNKTSKTVTFSDFAAVVLERLLVITNVTRNTMIYLFTDPTLGGTVTGNTLTLTFDTSAMANTDKLQIFYETADTPALDTTAQTVNVSVQALTDMVGLLKRIAQYTESLEVTDSAQRLRVDVDTFGPALLNNTFLGVAIQQDAASGGVIRLSGNTNDPGRIWQVQDVWKNVEAARLSYADGIRKNLTFS